MKADDYLWDGSGPPDPEVQRLEDLLRPLGHAGPEPRATPARPRWAFGGLVPTLAAAASLAVALGGALLAGRLPAEGWDVTRLRPVADTRDRIAGKARLRVGEWLETDGTTRARVRVGRIGQVEVEPRTLVGLVDAGRRSHRLSLVRGTLHASIWAPPGRFFVETPSAVAVDLGCAYTLEVDESGAGELRVESGWVGFEYQGRESFVPQGARCVTRPGVGPGTPHYEDASPALIESLTRLDFEGDGDRAADLRVVLEHARRRDALSLWHLLARARGGERTLVYERIAGLVAPPAGVTREGVLRGDREMLDAWWEELDLGSADWWRLWKAPWPPRAR